MSNDASSARSNHRKLPLSLPNENEFETSSNQIPLLPSRPPLNSIPDPSQYQSKTPPQQFHHGDSSKAASTSKKSEGITHTQLISSFIKTPTVHNKGKSPHSEPNSAHSTPIRSGPRLSNIGAAPGGCTLSRLPLQSSNAVGRAGAFPRVSRGISIGIPEQISAHVPNFELEEDPLFWKDHNVQVLIRIRPLNSTEMMSQGYRKCLHQESAQTVVWLGQPESRFTFDHIACESVSQEKLFRVAGLPMVDNCISGYNSCMFAYGQTGSGKTYTMMGEFDKMDGELSNDCGITPRIFEYLFTRITKEEESRKHERLTFSCKCSFLEIYNEQITDLLEPSSTNLQLREDSKKGVYVENLTEYNIGTVNDVLQLLQQGAVNRKIAATHMNSESSRSHSVFTCIIESRWEKDSMAHFRFGRLNLVDLAGSERQKSSGAEGDRLREAANINKSLSTLGLVIMSLVDLAHGKHRHVPYRDSRLTFLLQDSLGGNSKTTIIANVSPSTCSANETLSTLKFAQRAKLIQNNAKINEDASGNVIALQQQIQQLKGQLSFLMKHQHASELLDFAPSPRKYSLCYLPERYELNEELNMYDEPNTPKGEIMKMKAFKATLLGSLRREKLAELEVKRLKAEIEHLNHLAHQREEEAQCTKMMLRFREEKIKRMETLSNGLISADKFSLDENNALKEENLLLQAKIEKNPEVTRFALENIRLLEQIKMFQDFYEKGERETLLAEISELRNQLLESLELETSYLHHQFSPMKRNQETGNSKELERCKDMNSKLIREVDELRYQLENGMNCSQDTSNSIENVLPRSDSVDEATSSNLPGDEVIYEKSDKQMEYILDLQCGNVQKRLMDAQSLIETMRLGQFQLIRELESFQTENECLKKMLHIKEIPQKGVEAKQEDYRRKQSGIGNQDPTVPGSDDTSIAVLQSKLDKLSRDLNEAEILNQKYVEDHATRLSQDHQTELVRNEVEMETTKAIIELQEEMDRLQSEFQEQLCSMAEQNLSLQNSVAAKENELRTLSTEWERATLELTTFLIDGSRSLRDASRQIKCISSSFPNVKYWISEHVERAAKRCLEKEETILVLQKSLEDAQMAVMEMEQKLYSLKGATIALTEFQQPQKSSSIEEIQFSTMSNEPTEENEFPENKTLSKKGQIIHNQANAPILVENRSNYPTSTLSGIVERNLPLAHTNVFERTDVDDQIKLTRLILSEIEEAVNGSYSDAEAHWFHLNSDIHNAVTLYKELVQNLLNDVSDMRKDINELKKNRGSLQFSNDTSQLHVPLKHENQLQMLEQIRNELVETNGRLNAMNACFHKVINMHCNLDSTEDLSETDGWTTDCSSLCSYSSVGSVDDDDKSSTSEKHRCTSKTTEQTLDLISDEGSTLSHRRSVLLLRHEFRKTYGAFVKLNNHLMTVYGGKMDQNRTADILSFPDPHAIEKLKEQGRDGHDEPTSQRVETGSQTFEELAVARKHSPPSSFFAKFEEAYATIKEADYMLRAMLTANENANMMTAMWKQAREELMSDKASLTEEIKQLKSCILLRDGEKEVLQDEIQSSLREKANILSLLEEHLPPIQTGVRELSETASGDATQVVEETQAFFCRLRSSLEDLMCKEMQKDISIFVLQCQMRDHLHRLGRLNTVSNSDKSALLEHSLIADKLEISHLSQDDNSVFHPLECESKGDQIAYVLGREIKELDLVHDDTVHKNSDLKRELERKDILLKGLLFDFSLLQELASSKNDIKYELEKLIVALSKVQNELEVKTVQLDDLLVQNTNLQGCLAEAEQALFNSNSELDQAKGTLNILSEQNAELKGLLQDLYLKNSEAEHLLEEQREVIESLEKEIIRVSSSSDKQLAPSLKDIEDNLTRVTAERDELLEKLISLQDKLDMACALGDENQAIAVEARQESEASKMYAEQKEEEVKILEHSVEELESTINVLEKKVHEMEEEVEKQRLIRDSLEVQLQALKHRLLTVEDLTESMTSEKSSLSVPEDQLSRKLHFKSLEVNEVRGRIKFLEEENTKQAKEIKQFKDYISELVLHAEAQASQFQQKYKALETMLHKVNTDSSNVSAAPTLERSDKTSTKTRGSSSPFRCIAGLVQHMNQEKDQELSIARLRIEELEAQAASRHREVCMLNARLATAESMTHDVIRDLLSVKLDLSNYANIIDQHQLQKLIEEAQHQRQEYFAMEHEIVNLRSQIDDLLEERERCLLEINKSKSDQLGTQIFLEQLKERDQMLIAQNDMLKMDKSNLQKRVAELDDMVKKLITIQDSQPHNRPQRRNSLSMPYGSDLDERLTHSQKVLSRINNQLAQYGRPEGTCPHDKMDRHGNEVKFRKQKP